MAGEASAFIDGFDHAFLISRDLDMLLSKRLSISMYTDSKQLFDAMTRGKHTSERRLMIEIMAVRQAYRKLEIAGVALVSGDTNPAEGLSKINDNGSLYNKMKTMVDSTPVSQWRQRTSTPMQTPQLISLAAA